MALQDDLRRYNELLEIRERTGQQGPEWIQAAPEFAQLQNTLGPAYSRGELGTLNNQFVPVGTPGANYAIAGAVPQDGRLVSDPRLSAPVPGLPQATPQAPAQPGAVGGGANLGQLATTQGGAPTPRDSGVPAPLGYFPDASTGQPQTPGQSGQQTTQSQPPSGQPIPGVGFTMKNPATGETREISNLEYNIFHDLAQQGWRPLNNETGEPAEIFPEGDGWWIQTEDGPVPVNVFAGEDWKPGQLDQALQHSFSGTLAAPYPDQFQWDPSRVTENPAYQFAMDQMGQATERSASARLNLLGGATQKALQRNAAGIASIYGNQDYDRQRLDFDQAYNQFVGDRTRQYNMLQGLAEGGQVAGNQLRSTPLAQAPGVIGDTSGRVGDLAVGAGDARASSYAAGANAYGQIPGNVADDLTYAQMASRYRR